ncbi:substrate-binding domain-containing protein [Salipaludibacillus sp. CUR1]|uniref:substrate-binding domain-containing protein n=1 Tax=Salipaludibacillus sp. CUR1 TaxID=2820003 RepID=UPI001E37E012|nr:substrate-binding domain-containing protein [Salipaludibacillus sp. CUR1]MCE7791351.1 substrate-binding domain-containing protein [Salipaludibacillus sp. CUR1]
MKDNIGVRIVYFIFFTGLIIFGGYIAAFLTAIFGGLAFYTPLVVAIAGFLIIYLAVYFFIPVRPKVLKIAAAVFFSLAVLSAAGYWGYNTYIDNLKMVTDRGVDLHDYQPFEEGTNVAVLETQSSFQIGDELPVMDGATALYPVYASFAQAVYPEKNYDPYGRHSEVVSTKTDEAYNRLISGEADIIFAAGPSENQELQAERYGVELELTPIGKEAFVFFVNSRNPVAGLTVEDIQSIYSGETANWKEVGGNDEAIRAFQRPADSGSQTALENLMGNTPLMEPPTEDVVGGMGGIISETANYHNYRNALGYSFRYFSTEMVQNGDIKHLEIEGVYPEKETIRDGTYPITSEFYAVTAGSDNPHVDDLIDWILSPEGQELIEKSGYVPVN